MKKFIFLLITMISVVICQAIPPPAPDVGICVQHEQVYTIDQPCADFVAYQFVDQPSARAGDESVYVLHNAVLNPVSNYAEKNKEAVLPECTELALLTANTDESWNRYKPPLISNGSFNNRPIDLQHTNYGYPLTGN